MKCKYCNGTGYDDTQRGIVMTEFPPCPWCGGSGYVKDKYQTNEEWFDTLPTKEKAEWLDKVAENCCQICDEENRELCRGNIAIGCKFENAKKWEMWLKQPHTNE